MDACLGVGSIRVGTDPVGDEVCSEVIVPDNGPGLVLTTGARTKLTERGIRWANVPDGRADFVVHRSQRVWHVNTPMLVLDRPVHVVRNGDPTGGGPGDSSNGGYSGAIKFRFRDYRRFPVPDRVLPDANVVNHIDPQGHILDANTEALWRFDEALSTDDLVDIANGHTVQEFHGPPPVPGKIDGARYVTGSSTAAANTFPNMRYLQGHGDASMGSCFSGSWTVEMWVNPDFHPIGSNMFIYNGLQFSFNDADTIMVETQYDVNPDKISGKVLFHQWHNPSSFTEMVSSGSINSGSWSHVALSRQSQLSGNLYTFNVYIDGVLDSTFPDISGLDFVVPGDSHFIGIGNFIGISGFGIGLGNPFTGKIDDSRVSRVARSPSEILDSYNRGIGT